MDDFETHPAGTADLVKRLRGYQEFEQNRDGQIVCVESEIANEAADRIEQLVATVEQIEDCANAATAAAYEVAARALDTVADQWSCGHPAMHCDCARDIEQWGFAAGEVRALATPDQTAALDKLIAEAVGPYVDALKKIADPETEFRGHIARTILAASKKGGAA